MTDAMHASANFRLAAMDLAGRLSSLQHYVPAANELISRSECLQQRDVARHARKIVALIEISRQTLLRIGLRLYHFAACPSALTQHKSCFFDLLRMLKKRRCFVDHSDNELQDRIDRLLLPLSSNLRIASAEDTAAPSSGRSRSIPLVSPPHSPVCFPSMVTRGTSAAPRGYGGSSTHGKMLPPDVLMMRSRKRRVYGVLSGGHMDLSIAQQANQVTQTLAAHEPSSDSVVDEIDDSDRPVPVVLKQPRRRFGILFTPGSRPGHRRSGNMR